MTAFDDYLPELRWTAAALPDTELNLVAVFSPEAVSYTHLTLPTNREV